MTYCYRCPECGATRESDTRDWMEWCGNHGIEECGLGHRHRRLVPMVRDYRTEAVMIGAIR